MPAEIVTLEDCASNYGVFHIPKSKGPGHWTVELSGSEGPAHCDCPSFQYSGPYGEQTCKHVRRVWKEACLYNPQWHDANPEPEVRPVGYTYTAYSDTKCECGGPMVFVRRAV